MIKHADHDGLAETLRALRDGTVKRRELVRWSVATGLVTLVGCGDDDGNANAAGSGGGAAGRGGNGGAGGAGGRAGSGGTGGAADGCSEIPEETAGPYPADGSNSASSGGPGGSPRQPGQSGGETGSGDAINALIQSGIVRSDIRSSFGISTTQAEGVPLTIKLRVVDASAGCSPVADAAVYIWHCDRSGNYSLYSQAITSENYLRGVQETDDDGYVTFTSIFPACYSGRWPHIHFEVYPNLSSANAQSNAIKISQIALPQDACNTVFAEDGYETSVTNLRQVTLTSDMVFSDSYQSELGNISGSVRDGYTIELTAGVRAD